MWFLVGAALCLFACSSRAESETAFSPPNATAAGSGTIKIGAKSRAYVITQVASVGSNAPLVRAPAKIAFREGAVSEVDTPTPGRITTVHVKIGDRVKAGDPLVTLTSADAASARASLTAAQAAYDAAVQEANRQDHMAQSGVGVDSDRVAAQARLRQAQAELERSRTTTSMLGGGGGSVLVVRAPIDGTVIARRATVGAVAEPGGESMIEIGNPNALWVVADVFERDLNGVKEGAEVDVELASRTEPIKGHVQSVGSALTGATRTAPVYISFDDQAASQGDIRAGMFARAAIKGPPGETIFLPAEAVLVKDGKTFLVYVKTGEDTYVARQVKIGRSVGGQIAILSGLKAGEVVAIKGALLLDGASEQML
jgi:cobalt-zinc-cadmium efflux system membrane fusion protein